MKIDLSKNPSKQRYRDKKSKNQFDQLLFSNRHIQTQPINYIIRLSLNMSVTKKQLIKLIPRFLVAISLLAWVFTQINFHQLTTAIKGAKWQFFIANCILGLLYYWINSIKMKLILKKQDCDVSIGILFETSSIATLYSLVMPGLLSSAVKWYL